MAAVTTNERTSALSRLFNLINELCPASVRSRMWITLGVGIGSSVFEAAGVASIMPFIAVLLDPSTLDRYASARRLFEWLGAHSTSDRTVLLGSATAATLIVGNAIAVASLWTQQRFIASTKTRISSALFDAYLSQPYALHSIRDSASLTSVALYDADAAARMILATFQLTARLVVVLLLLALLLWQDPAVAVWTTLVLGGSYALVYRVVRRRQSVIGAEISLSYAERARVAAEAFGGIKDLLVLGRERAASDHFLAVSRRVAEIQKANALTGYAPRFLLEAIAYCGVIVAALALVVTRGGGGQAIPTLALFAFAGYRLLPSLQQVFYSAVELRFTGGSIRTLMADWRNLVPGARSAPWRSTSAPAGPHSHTAPDIVIRDLSFRYPGTNRDALTALNFSVGGGQCIGVVGRTGSGKSTLSDILLGLQVPDQGSVTFGAERLNALNVRRWRGNIGYVSQHIFLANATIAENIAFGLEPDAISMDRVESAAAMAQATEFIERLPLSFSSVVGERGIKLSGGQRQRIGIARALYMQPNVLIFDEATSALDSVTEDAVMRSILLLGGTRTLVLIAHRLRTVQSCDQIFLMESGRIVASGTYNQLLESSTAFQRLAHVADVKHNS